MLISRFATRAMLGASFVALGLAASPASAQRIDRIVAFGDSYADDGNAFQLGYSNPQALAVYPTGRFSGGSNYIDTLATLLSAPVENFAIGGAFGGSNNGTLCYDPYYAPGTSPLCGRGLQYEVDQFLNVGTQSGVFPAGSATFDSNDLVTVSIGGNDARFYQQAGGTLALAPTAGGGAALATTAQLNRLVAAGAPTISFLAGDTGRLPEVAGSPTQAAIRTAYSTAFNTAMQSTLSGYAAGGTTVHYLDLNRVLDSVIANPTAYGINNGLVCPIFPDPTCVINSGGYLFYGDALHLTSNGFAIVAQYVATQLTAPLTLEAPSDLGLDVARQFGRSLSLRSDLNARSAAPGLRLFLTGDAFSRHVGSTDTNDAFDIDGAGVTAGAEMGVGLGMAGIAVNYTRPRTRFGNNAARDKGHSYQIGAYGGMAAGPLFAQAHVGYGSDKHRIDRAGVVEGMSASPDGSHILAGAKAGYLMGFGMFSAGPVVGLDYAHAKVDAYTEDGDSALTLNVGKQSLSALTGNLGIEVRGALGVPGVGFRPYASALLEKDLIGDGRTIFYSQTSAPTIVNHFRYEDRSQSIYGRLSAGAAASVLPGIEIDAGASTTLGRDQGNELSGHLGISFGF